MTISMYQASVPVFERMLGNLAKILEKGAAHAEAKKFDQAVLFNARLFPDMYTLSKQVQIAADMAKGGVARLAGEEPPRFEDTETTLTELVARCNKTIAFIKGYKPAQIDGSEGREIVLTIAGNPLKLTGEQYLLHFAMPNFYFHCTTAHAILRQAGVDVGKRDFIGGM